ncbi:LysR family transcriptional regulator [Noviherbaspirillum sp. UKPF54]|uniref:LysR family transcriptional regulator n=1 Tax=Noviherbaspirillum sp. UKPF54 TaxID=2601898 RepID=UPI0011B18DE2|nr:LysR family transcriptional regulator [Noviherbaspirillum sp. UKPF54]QDZ28067.1 LysR family transcriptional regulator [Noviherbaspirillum sp. UKPF54]
MDLFQAMKVFIKVAETGSLSGAARALDISNPSVTRHVCDLESYLSARLFNRSTRRLSLTETGAAYLERCRQVLAAVEDAASAASSSVADPGGTLRISAPVSFAVNRLGRVLPRYAQRYPRVQLDVALSDRVVDLVEEGYDLAIRIGNIQDSSLVARKIAPMRLAVCASPAYLARHGSPQTPRDLERHACLNYSYWALRDEWQFTRDGVTESVRIAGTMRVNNGDLLREAALAGMGIVMQPTFIVGDDIRNGALVPVLADYRLPESAIHAVYPSRQHLSAKVRTFIDFLVQELDPARESRVPG